MSALGYFPPREVAVFILELSLASEPGEMLESWGVCEKRSDLVPMLVEMAVQWIKDSSTVTAACGSHFYYAMTQAAMNRAAYEAKEAVEA
jgi:hypothetical protein